MRLRDILKESEDRGLSNEVKKHFLEIVSTYNKYQESTKQYDKLVEMEPKNKKYYCQSL